ncbi:MAG TPA: alkaline phosphatase family protein [Candidatus Rubrimentiphilum sp.]|nr:alkaline phosphatase family protein [Candidatus Rubrimentiphilum sp.]
MLRVCVFISAALALMLGAASAAPLVQTVLPSGWRLAPPPGPVAIVGDMPQGIALSPDGTSLAVVESGVNPAALRLLDPKTLNTQKTIALAGAFGNPVWDVSQIYVAGANTDALLAIDTVDGTVTPTAMGKGSWPAAVAISGSHRAVAADLTNNVNLDGAQIAVGSHPENLLFSPDGSKLFVTLLASNRIAVIDVATHAVRTIAVGRHPLALALSSDGAKLFVAETDDDAVAIVDTRSEKRIADIPVGFASARVRGYGANPNALLVAGNDLFVSLGGENAVALVRNRHVVAYIPAGWYPTGLALAKDGTLYVSNGKGERSPANPQFSPFHRSTGGYVGSITVGSVRAIPRSVYADSASQTAEAYADAMPRWHAPAQTILRAHGPIAHVIYVIKENRSYDQVLGDIASANGDPALVEFGRTITPNQHVLAQRFGVFDNAYTDAQVSADGHNWTDAATANDYVERTWPPNYGNRRPGFDMQNGVGAPVPHNGFLWDAAKRAGISYEDYGEDMTVNGGPPIAMTDHPALAGHYDPAFVGWNLKYSDLLRLAEWKREFRAYVLHHNLPQLEIVYLPNDHTSGGSRGAPTPQAYVATNDWATGQLVDIVSHSPYWKSTAIFILEDDAQNGPDHVSDQRSTFYIASPYARGGVHHEHYSTVSFVRTIELLLGLPAMSVKDATTRPLYAAFALSPVNAKPFDATKPTIDLNATNARTAYGSAISAKLDFSRPDAVDPKILNDILEHLSRHR